MFDFLKRKSLASALSATRRLLVKGVVFEVQKISVTHFIEGSKVMKQTVGTYQTKEEKTKVDDFNWDKVKAHYADVILAGVVSPKLARKESDEGVFVEKLFTDWEMCNELYEAISEMTYGKKKLRSIGTQGAS